MKLSLFVGFSAIFVAALPAAAGARPGGMIVSQAGRAAPSGLGSYGRVGEPFPPIVIDRSFRHRGSFREPAFLGGWGSGLRIDPESLRDSGFFAGSADAWRDGKRVYYDYDRAYPYDWYREGSARTALPIAYGRSSGDRVVRCEVEGAGVRVCRGSR